MLRAGIEYLEKDDIVRHIVAKKLRGYEGTTRKEVYYICEVSEEALIWNTLYNTIHHKK
jgi:hypothetical protein